MQTVILQLDLVWHDRAANHRRAEQLLEGDPPAAGDLVVLPEAFGFGFTMDIDAAADINGQTTAFVQALARKYQVTVVAGNMIKPDNLGRNIAHVVGPDGEMITTYEKIHPFTFANEHKKFRGGDRVATFQWDGAVIAPLICYDLRFPEVFRIATRAGTEIFVVIANWPTARVHHWTTLLAARAIENQAYVIGCNRCGSDPNVAYPGRSGVFDPRGQLIGDAGGTEGVLRVEIDVESLRQYRREFPALNDMRFVGEKLR